jgi:hypothetical protein
LRSITGKPSTAKCSNRGIRSTFLTAVPASSNWNQPDDELFAWNRKSDVFELDYVSERFIIVHDKPFDGILALGKVFTNPAV